MKLACKHFTPVKMATGIALIPAPAGLQLNVTEPVMALALFVSIATAERAVTSLRVKRAEGITTNTHRTRAMALSSVSFATLLKPSPGYRQSAELAGEVYGTEKSFHDIVVKERNFLRQGKWDEVFSFDDLVNPRFEPSACPQWRRETPNKTIGWTFVRPRGQRR